MVSIVSAPWSQFSERLMKVRTNVFVDEQGISADLEHDKWDEKSFHVLLSIDSRDAATGRLLPNGYIGRVCVIKEFRGTGLGKQVMTALIEKAKEEGIKEVSLSSQIQAAQFYKRLGFKQISDEYIEAGIPHIKMNLKL